MCFIWQNISLFPAKRHWKLHIMTSRLYKRKCTKMTLYCCVHGIYNYDYITESIMFNHFQKKNCLAKYGASGCYDKCNNAQ